MQRIGVFQETDIGEIQFQFGFQTTVKKLSALNQSSNLKNYQVSKVLLIFTENLLTKSQFLLNKAKVNLKEFQKFSIVGLSLELCHLLRVIIHSRRLMKNS